MSNINVFLFCQLGKEGLIKNIMPTVACLTATYRRWGDKTSYLKNVKCSGEPKNLAALTL